MGQRGIALASLNPRLWQDRKILITGHTGFKGTWLAQVLQKLGSKVSGYALEPNTTPSHFELLKWDIRHQIGDIREPQKLQEYFASTQPEVVFHMAAQPLVLRSYQDPVETYETNVMGTLHVLEAVRKTPSVKSVIVVTSDKCYENRETSTPYVETDPMGGFDPYSSSKGCTEILTASYRQSFFHTEKYGKDHEVLLASVRAGNVLGGGDYSEARLLPDFARAYAAKQKVVLRNPQSTRPWQHVLDPLHGYMILAEQLMNGNARAATCWNFGPELDSCWPVEKIVKFATNYWPGFEFELQSNPHHEAKLLMLDSSKAHRELKWKPAFNIEETLAWTLDWYQAFISKKEVLTAQQIDKFLELQ